MDINLDQLPIPDWGLECPQCRYALLGLPSHRCPECGIEFEMSELVKTWHRLREPRYTGYEDPLPDFGLACWSCKKSLAGARRQTCPHCDNRFDPDGYMPRRDWFIVDQILCGEISLAGLEPLLASEYIPHTRAQGKVLAEIYGVSNLVGSRLLVPREFYFDLMWLIQKTTAEIHEARSKRNTWTCLECREKVPANFDICWNCEQPRPPH